MRIQQVMPNHNYGNLSVRPIWANLITNKDSYTSSLSTESIYVSAPIIIIIHFHIIRPMWIICVSCHWKWTISIRAYVIIVKCSGKKIDLKLIGFYFSLFLWQFFYFFFINEVICISSDQTKSFHFSFLLRFVEWKTMKRKPNIFFKY